MRQHRGHGRPRHHHHHSALRFRLRHFADGTDGRADGRTVNRGRISAQCCASLSERVREEGSLRRREDTESLSGDARKRRRERERCGERRGLQSSRAAASTPAQGCVRCVRARSRSSCPSPSPTSEMEGAGRVIKIASESYRMSYQRRYFTAHG